jgi:putative ABC transport system ATP-binding protein
VKSPLIIAKNIVRRFGTGDLEITVLKGIDVTVADGEFLAIMGKSGAGKSTLMYQLSVLDTPSEGSITIDGADVLDMNETEKTSFRLHTLGYVFQNYALVPDLSARENCMLPLLMRGLSRGGASDFAASALSAVGLDHRLDSLPALLSGGEQQRVSIARAIAGSPKILFADEPTANLDSVSGRAVIDLLAELHKQGQTIVMVTHEPDYAEVADRIIYLEDGQIVNEKIIRSQT